MSGQLPRGVEFREGSALVPLGTGTAPVPVANVLAPIGPKHAANKTHA
jgi:hypothetical protein